MDPYDQYVDGIISMEKSYRCSSLAPRPDRWSEVRVHVAQDARSRNFVPDLSR